MPMESAPLLLNSPPDFFPSFFRGRVYKESGAPFGVGALHVHAPPYPEEVVGAGRKEVKDGNQVAAEGSDLARFPLARAMVSPRIRHG